MEKQQKMSVEELMKTDTPYCSRHGQIDPSLQARAKELVWEYNMSRPSEGEKRKRLLKQLLGSCTELTFIEPPFHCDYGFNIHFEGMALLNYNCVMLDTSPIHIGADAFIGPGCCLTCAGHALDPQQRKEGIGDSAPIRLEDGVWLGANSTVCAGVTVGAGSVIGAGSVVTKDIPAGVIAVGVPCRVLRPITEQDRMELSCPDGKNYLFK